MLLGVFCSWCARSVLLLKKKLDNLKKKIQVREISTNSPSSLSGCALDGDQVAVGVIAGEIRAAC